MKKTLKTILLVLLLSTVAQAQISVSGKTNKTNNSILSSRMPADGREMSGSKENAKQYGYFSPLAGVEDETTAMFPHRGGELDWGLALSGGGIRSATYSIGVMKALYDKGILDRIDVISSVSGGGYASYWLYMNYALAGNSGKFGESAFGNDVFVRNVCRIQEKGDFISRDKAFKMFIKDKKETFEIYENSIRRTFGNMEHGGKKINFIKDEPGKEPIPYFIFNAALKSKELGKLGQVVEITSKYMGNPVLGFYKWKIEDAATPAMSEAVAISGAAIKWKWRRLLDNYAREVIRKDKLYLADGGFTENSGAFPLIRRGIKKVIIVDAEHDPKYKFDAYVKLRQALFNMGIDFCVEGISACTPDGKTAINFSRKSVNTGYAKSTGKYLGETPIDTKIIYIKMSKPDWIFPPKDKRSIDASQNNNVRDEALKNGEKLILDRNNQIRVTETSYDCEKALNFQFNPDMYLYRAVKYDEFLRNKKALNFIGKLLPKSFRYNFPQIPTFDQNYYTDELEAFVALGYLQASEWDAMP